MNEQRLTELFYRYIDQTATPAEEAELMHGLTDPKLEAITSALIEAAYDRLPERFQMTEAQAEAIFSQIIGKQTPVVELKPARKIIAFTRVAAAAVVLLMLGAGSYFYFSRKTEKPTDNKVVQSAAAIAAPRSSRATITLGSGKQIFLDSAASGTLALQGSVQVTKLTDGGIAYTGNAPATKEILYNTLTNPRGSRMVSITLSDDTRVWLNAESSLRYPAAFAGPERRVEITGEAYFEVAHNAAMPFIVGKGLNNVRVLGTHFNVNAYDDEASIKITLLEGSVKVNNSVIIAPGEQAVIQSGMTSIQKNIDLDNVMAWKNGKFDFGARADLGLIMRQLARWYDIEVSYQGTIPKQEFGGEMPRSSDLNQVLEILRTSGVKFTIEGKKVIVMP